MPTVGGHSTPPSPSSPNLLTSPVSSVKSIFQNGWPYYERPATQESTHFCVSIFRLTLAQRCSWELIPAFYVFLFAINDIGRFAPSFSGPSHSSSATASSIFCSNMLRARHSASFPISPLPPYWIWVSLSFFWSVLLARGRKWKVLWSDAAWSRSPCIITYVNRK